MMYTKFTGKRLDTEIARVLSGKKPATTAAPEVLVSHLAHLLAVDYEWPDEREERNADLALCSEPDVAWCEQLFRLRDPRPLTRLRCDSQEPPDALRR